ncbi:hypothetical protein PFBG_01946 [Plasmodium falciparum 7G8]|uniref:Rifin n=1 Tax=Plasmodium falciparum (isolate 7G8) TaxID=57266 RepID=W7FFC1_PLAF8|nr:hypothetical protein PFBG_01946 [Plasmodium falciparum 7G8]
MMLNYTNILLFYLSLNILSSSSEVYNQRKHKSTTHHTQKIPTTRLLCECELYASANYDSDPQMKSIMEIFNKQTQQRFHEYDERMKTTRQKCREQCDKEIQKIILKDKLEKELMDKFATLHTDMQSDAIPTCICEKSLADKTEKFCLNCGKTMGGVAPGWGLISGIVYTGWKASALAAATKEAIAEGAAKGLAAGTKAGIKAIMDGLYTDFGLSTPAVKELGLVFNAQNYNNSQFIFKAIFSKFEESCMPRVTGAITLPGPGPVSRINDPVCSSVFQNFALKGHGLRRDAIRNAIEKKVETMVLQAEGVAEATKTQVTSETTAELTAKQTTAINTIYMGKQTAIIASVVAILVIVLIMVIIYLILRYRRKKQMNKKLKYIKLLKE